MVEIYLIISCIYGIFVAIFCFVMLLMAINYESGMIDVMKSNESVKRD